MIVFGHTHQEIGRINAALRNESRQASAEFGIRRAYRHHVEGVVDEVEEGINARDAHRLKGALRILHGPQYRDHDSTGSALKAAAGDHMPHLVKPRWRSLTANSARPITIPPTSGSFRHAAEALRR